MNRRSISLLTLGFAAVLATSGCGAKPITAARLDAAVGPTFARLYVLQQQDKGPLGSPRTTDGIARCARSTATGPQQGAGDDWTCTVNFPYPDGHIEPIAYDVSVQGTGCYSASGPATIVGSQTMSDASGHTVTNPLFAFDGCMNLY